MSDMIEGVIHGRSIVLEADPGLADGQRVRVRIEPAAQESASAPVLQGVEPVPEDEGTVYTPLTDPALIETLAQIRRNRRPLPPSPTGPGRRSAAGMLADDPKWDEHMREVMEARKTSTYRDLDE